MTKDEALKMALEALVRADRISGYPNNKDTIAVVKEALKQPENQVDDINVVDIPAQQCQHKWEDKSSKWQTVYQCELCGVYTFEQPAQPAQQQDPAAWWHKKSDRFSSNNLVSRFDEWTPLYESPPASKPWVSLTDEERRELRKRNQQHDAFAKAVDAALKEKNA